MTEEKQMDVGLLILRVSLGITFIAHGYLKVFTFGLKHAMEVFEAHTVWHINMIPGWFAPPAALIEWVGGILLILDVKTRLGIRHLPLPLLYRCFSGWTWKIRADPVYGQSIVKRSRRMQGGKYRLKLLSSSFG